jgi:hypothetical protein
MKLPYQYVARHVDELYLKPIDPRDVDGINKHCEFIRDFINACGWNEDDLLRTMYPSKDPRLSQEELDKLN